MRQRSLGVAVLVLYPIFSLGGYFVARAHEARAEEAPPMDERGQRIEISRLLRRTQASLRLVRRRMSNARDIHPSRAGAVQTHLLAAEDAMREAQGELTRGKADGE
jgi:hypothetical protein